VSAPALCGPRHIPRDTTTYENQPEAVFWQLRAKEMEDIIGICNYMGTYFGVRALDIDDYTELTRSALGIDLTEDEFMNLGQQAYNLEKAFNTIHAGFTRTDDIRRPDTWRNLSTAVPTRASGATGTSGTRCSIASTTSTAGRRHRSANPVRPA